MAPGQRECDRAIEELRILYQEVDKALTNVETLRKTDKSLQVKTKNIFQIKIFSYIYILFSFIKNKSHLVLIF